MRNRRPRFHDGAPEAGCRSGTAGSCTRTIQEGRRVRGKACAAAVLRRWSRRGSRRVAEIRPRARGRRTWRRFPAAGGRRVAEIRRCARLGGRDSPPCAIRERAAPIFCHPIARSPDFLPPAGRSWHEIGALCACPARGGGSLPSAGTPAARRGTKSGLCALAPFEECATLPNSYQRLGSSAVFAQSFCRMCA